MADELVSKRVRGSVSDDAGAALAGARLTATCDGASVVSTAGDDGGYELELHSRLVNELQADILSSYQRDDSLDFEKVLVETALIDPKVGPARIGVGPGDVRYGPDVNAHPSSRWPFVVAAGKQINVRSKRLDLHLSVGQRVTAAWMSDEVSWEIPVCGETAAIPFRITALYAHDGDQWFEVVEHVSFGRSPTFYPDLRGARITDAFSGPQLVDYPLGELGAPLAALLSSDIARIRDVVSLDPQHKAEGDPTRPAPTFLLGPAPNSEWHGDDDLSHAQLGVGSIQPEDRRVGLIGVRGAVAYWVGNFVADLPARPDAPGGKVRLRGTFVFEKRCATQAPKCLPDKWFVVQGHMSEPIDDEELAHAMFGSALVSVTPLLFDCARRPARK